jgi:RNA polymerase sigma factor (sigma-70 family)
MHERRQPAVNGGGGSQPSASLCSDDQHGSSRPETESPLAQSGMDNQGVANHSAPIGILITDMTISDAGLMVISDGPIIGTSLRDPEAFAKLFDRHWARIFVFCVSRAGSAGEDIAAETFKVAFDRRERFDPSYGDARPWLFGIATNLLRHHFRSGQRAKRAGTRILALLPQHAAMGAGEEFEARTLTPELSAALANLSEEERDALLLLAWADLNYAEIARALDIPIGTVRSRIHRARNRVRAHLAEEKIDD